MFEIFVIVRLKSSASSCNCLSFYGFLFILQNKNHASGPTCTFLGWLLQFSGNSSNKIIHTYRYHKDNYAYNICCIFLFYIFIAKYMQVAVNCMKK